MRSRHLFERAAWIAMRIFQYYLPSFRHGFHLKLYLANGVCGLLPDFFSGVIRGKLYRLAGFDIGNGAFIMGNVEFITSEPGLYDKLTIGSGTVVSTHVTINLDDAVTVGSNVCISPHVLIYTGSHRMGPGRKRMGPGVTKPVIIEDGAWIRLGAMILPGVTVGKGSVVGAGAVLFENVAPNTYVAGNPARVVRELRDGDR